MSRPFALIALAAFVTTSCDVSNPVRFTADAGEDPCAPLFLPSEPAYVDLACELPACVATVQQDGCHLRIKIEDCQNHEISATLGKDRIPVFEPSATAGSCVAVKTAAGARLSFTCASPTFACDFDLYAGVDRRDDFVVTSLVIDEREYAGPPPRVEKFLNYTNPFAGWLGGMAMLRDELVIAKHGRLDAPQCGSGTSTVATFEFVDLETFSITHSAPAPECAFDLIKDPNGDGFIAGYGGSSPKVGIFDARGALVKSATIAVDADHFFIDLDVAFDVLYVLISSDAGSSFVSSFTLPSLAPRRTSLNFEHRARAVLAVRPGGVAISDGERNGIRLLDAELNDYGVIQLISIRGRSDDPGSLVTDPVSGLLMVTTTGSHAAIWVLDPLVSEALRGQGVVYEQPGVPWAMVPFEGTKMLTGITLQNDERTAMLALFELDGAHFLPGMIPLGRGVVRALLPDTQGNFYALLPWEARLVRIDPR